MGPKVDDQELLSAYDDLSPSFVAYMSNMTRAELIAEQRKVDGGSDTARACRLLLNFRKDGSRDIATPEMFARVRDLEAEREHMIEQVNDLNRQLVEWSEQAQREVLCVCCGEDVDPAPSTCGECSPNIVNYADESPKCLRHVKE